MGQFDAKTVDVILHGVDLLGCMVDQIRNPELEEVDNREALAIIRQLLQNAGVEKTQQSQLEAKENLATIKLILEQEHFQVDNVTEQEAAVGVSPPEDGAAQAASVRDDLFTGIQDEGGIPEQYMSIFIDEAYLSLDTLPETLMAAEAGQGPEALESLLIVSHRIKGSAASVGLNRQAKFAHLMEDILQ